MKGDIFVPDADGHSPRYIVHCVSNDLHMGKGFAKSVVQYSTPAAIRSLRSINHSVGSILTHTSKGREYFHLVTKEKFHDKPTEKQFASSVHDLYEVARMQRLPYLAMPFIGAGRDKLDPQFVMRTLKANAKKFGIPTYIYKYTPVDPTLW